MRYKHRFAGAYKQRNSQTIALIDLYVQLFLSLSIVGVRQAPERMRVSRVQTGFTTSCEPGFCHGNRGLL